MRKVTITLAACLAVLAARPALALPDLAVGIKSWQQIAGTSKVTVVVEVTNLSATSAANPEDASPEQFIPVMFFPDQATAPTFTDSTIHVKNVPYLAPQQSWQWTFTVDYEFPGTNTAWVLVDPYYLYDPSFGLPEESKDNNLSGPHTLTVQSQGGAEPDLIIADFTAQVDGPQVEYALTVQNVGNAVAPVGFFVDVLFDTPGGVCPPPEWLSPPIDLYGDVYIEVPGGLGPGETKIIELIGSPGQGLHTSCAMIDLGTWVDEGNEANNFAGPVTYEVSEVATQNCADLTIDAFSIQALGGQVTYNVVVENIGNQPAGAFTLDLYANSATPPVKEEPATHFWPVPSLAAGAKFSASWVEPAAQNGQKTAWAWADPDNAVTECLTTNNLEGPYPYTVAVAEDRPDVVVAGDVTWTIAGTSLCYEVTVLNRGAAPAQNVDVDLFYSWDTNPNCADAGSDLANAPQDLQTIPSLGAGASITLDFCWDEPVEGEHTSWVKLDCFNNVDESDETNNDKGPVQVNYVQPVTDGPDLVLVDFKGKVSCTNVNYVAKVCNTGDQDAAPFQIDLYYDRETNPGYTAGPGDKTVFYGAAEPYQPGLKAAECLDVLIKRSGTPSNTYKSWLVIDTALQVPEKTATNPLGEANNMTWVDIVVDAEGCACEQNVEIGSPCACAGETVLEGYCCNGQWQLGAFDQCSDIGTGDGVNMTENDTPGGDASGGGDTLGGSDVSGGFGPNFQTRSQVDSRPLDCTASPVGEPATAAIVLLALASLALIRRRKLQPQRVRRQTNHGAPR